MWRLVGRLLAGVLFVLLSVPPATAQAQKRFALLIGNQSYTPAVGPLKNPHNDVALVGKALEQVGFAVTIHRDLGFRELNVAVRRHIQQLSGAGNDAVGFLYYSGHGA